MAGYGNADDHLGAQEAHVTDSMALASLLAGPTDNRHEICLECGDDIPPARRAALPGCRYCLPCQYDKEAANKTHAAFQLRNIYVP